MTDVNLETNRLLMRPFTMNEADDLHRLMIDPDVRKFLWDDQVISRETMIEVVESSVKSFVEHGFGYWTINLREKPGLIGFCGLRHFQDSASENTQVEILYGILPEHWGKGLATEAAGAVLRYGFTEIGLESIYAGADPPNEASFRVMEKIGMKFSRRTKVNGLEAIYYVLRRDQCQPIHCS